MNFLKWCDRAIEYLFYALFLLVPLVFTGNTSELFEFNKMWLTFGISITIGFFWISKMIIRKQFIFRRTILDIPILLFLASQIISTVFSLDRHISLWGYYSRWNGGLISIITYIFLYYAFVSNMANMKSVMRSLTASLIAGFLVVLWALPSHFGHDPTCLAFRHTFDVSCWTADFQPKIRMFGSMGQPDWLAGYLAILFPIGLAFFLNAYKKGEKILSSINLKAIGYGALSALFLISLLFTGSKAGFIGAVSSLMLFLGFLGYQSANNRIEKVISLGLPLLFMLLLASTFFADSLSLGLILFVTNLLFFISIAVIALKNKKSYLHKKLIPVLAIIIVFLISTFAYGTTIPDIDRFGLAAAKQMLTNQGKSIQKTDQSTSATSQSPSPASELGGSDSGQIRKIVWRGALNAWKANPVFGTGVETYAFAYYKYKPAEQNRVSEWNFLYNKAHNEYLNYLATTGIVGLLAYLSFIVGYGVFTKTNLFGSKFKWKWLKHFRAEKVWDKEDPLILSLLVSFFAILVINFFGFSVVIMNIYLFLIPAFTLVLYEFLKPKAADRKVDYISYFQWLLVCSVGVLAAFAVFMLIRYWRADVKYALGSNYDQVQQYQTAYPLLHDAVSLRAEPVYLDEMSVNDAVLASSLGSQASTTESAQLVQSLATEALNTSDALIKKYPNNTVFWKSRVRVLYTLANLDPRFSPLALEAVKKTAEMAPNDAQILYNKGVLEGQNGDNQNAINTLEKTVELKPDYADAHFALGVFYHEASVDKNGKITNPAYHEKAMEEMQKTVKINPLYTQAQQYFDLWNKEQ